MAWYYFLDLFLNLLLHTPLTVMFWRGVWNLQDIYTTNDLSHHDIFSHSIVYVTGMVLSIFIYLTQAHQKHQWINLPKVPYYIVSRFYIIIFGTSIVCQWRGLWLLMDMLIGVSWLTVTLTTACAIIGLVLFRSYCNTLSPPAYVLTDWCRKTQFVNTTRYLCDYKESVMLYTLDIVFTVVVIHSSVIIVWRGIWEFLDLALFPDDMKTSGIYSMLIGYLLRITVAIIQPKIINVCKRLENVCDWLKIIIEYVYLFILNLSCVASWRGVWFLLDLYLFSFNMELSSWVSLSTGILALLILGTFNSILVRGCNHDASLALECVNIAYFSTVYETEKMQLNSIEATKLVSETVNMEMKVNL